MDFKENRYYQMPHKGDFCIRCPAADLRKLVTVECGDFDPYNSHTFEIEPTEMERSLLFFCDCEDYRFSTEQVCALTIQGNIRDIINLISHIKIK